MISEKVDAKRVESPDFFLSQIITPTKADAGTESIYEDVPCVSACPQDFLTQSAEKSSKKLKQRKADLSRGAQSSKNLHKQKDLKTNTDLQRKAFANSSIVSLSETPRSMANLKKLRPTREPVRVSINIEKKRASSKG